MFVFYMTKNISFKLIFVNDKIQWLSNLDYLSIYPQAIPHIIIPILYNLTHLYKSFILSLFFLILEKSSQNGLL